MRSPRYWRNQTIALNLTIATCLALVGSVAFVGLAGWGLFEVFKLLPVSLVPPWAGPDTHG